MPLTSCVTQGKKNLLDFSEEEVAANRFWSICSEVEKSAGLHRLSTHSSCSHLFFKEQDYRQSNEPILYAIGNTSCEKIIYEPMEHKVSHTYNRLICLVSIKRSLYVAILIILKVSIYSIGLQLPF